MPPSGAAAAVIALAIDGTPASNTVTPPPSSAIRYTFMVRGKPPRTRQTPSATGSASVPASRRVARLLALNAPSSRVSAAEPCGGSIPIWRAKLIPSGNAWLATSFQSRIWSRSMPVNVMRSPVGAMP